MCLIYFSYILFAGFVLVISVWIYCWCCYKEAASTNKPTSRCVHVCYCRFVSILRILSHCTNLLMWCLRLVIEELGCSCSTHPDWWSAKSWFLILPCLHQDTLFIISVWKMCVCLKFSLQKPNGLKKKENDYYVRVLAKVIEATVWQYNSASFDWKECLDCMLLCF